MTKEEFIKIHCSGCSSQRCLGANDETWNKGCPLYRKEVLGETPDNRESIFNSEAFKEAAREFAFKMWFKNHSMTNDNYILTKKLHERLVKCCADFIKEYKNVDIDKISFEADSLQEFKDFPTWYKNATTKCEISKKDGNNYTSIGYNI